jgi:glucuronoarabinoxylan endo-1,4-beta-xylanase
MLKSVLILAVLAAVAAPPVRAATTTIDTTLRHQTIEGFGGAIAFYNGWVTAHPYKQEIYTNAFGGLNLSMLRLGNWFRYTNSPDYAGFEIVSNANRILGHPVPILMSSWAPPAFLKSNGQVGNGGTLLFTNGSFAYTNFAQYWYDSLLAYRSNGVSPTWISIQNEPDWAAGYDSCVFHPTEDAVNGTNYASYSKALDATFQRLTNLPSPPKLLGPEVVGLGYNAVQNYTATMNANSFYGLAHHLYGGSTDGTPAGYVPAMLALTNIFPAKPKFMTEYGLSNMIDSASLIHYSLTVEQVSSYNFWSLVWPLNGGLVIQENPWNTASWTNAPPGTPTQSHGYWLAPSYWSMKHFSRFIDPGCRRVSAADTDNNVLTSAFLSPDNLRLVVVLINTNAAVPSVMNFNFGTFSVGNSSVYQTVGTNTFQSLGPLTNAQALPPLSLTTVVLDQNVFVGPATNPSPASGASGVALNSPLSWTPGSNALAHAVYLAVSSNAAAQATPASPLFQGILTATSFYPPLAGGTTCFWRVDEMIGANTNRGAVWSFTTVPVPLLVHRYSFSETGGTNAADSVGGPAGSGTLPKGGAFSGGQLILSSNSQQYVNLPAGILEPLTAVTIEAWATFPANLPWASWFFGFGNTNGVNGANYLFCSEGGGRFAVTGVSPGYLGETNAYTPGLNWSGKTLHLACVFNPAGGYIAIYTNGVVAGTNRSGTCTMSSISNTCSYLNRSLYANDPYVDLTLNEFRIYSAALSSPEIAATEALGPNQLLSTDSPSISITLTATSLTLTWPLASAGFTPQSRTNLVSGSWGNVTSPAPQIVGGQWQVTVSRPDQAGTTFYRLSK